MTERNKRTYRSAPLRSIIAAIVICICMAVMTIPMAAHAQAANPPTVGPTQACTDDPSFSSPQSSGPGLLASIASDIQNILGNLAQTMYQGITGDSGFKTALQAAVTLYIVIYGILFTLGIVQANLYDFLLRMIKIAIVSLLLLGDGGWSFFNQTVVPFFNQGTNDIINQLTSVATGIPMAGGQAAFAVLDTALAKAISPRMYFTTLAVFGTGPYGFIIGSLIVLALGSFLKSLVSGMWVYLMAMCLQALLFGMAPIFISCMLFGRTAHLFQGWLGQVVYTALAPILLFVFFSFFTVLISASIDNVTKVPVGYTQLSDPKRGSPISQNFWRFCVQDPNNSGSWMPADIPFTYTGSVMPGNNNGNNGNGNGNGNNGQSNKVFPIDILMVLVFLTLGELAGRGNDVAMEMSRGLSGVTTDLAGMQGSIGDWFKGGKIGGGGGPGGSMTGSPTGGVPGGIMLSSSGVPSGGWSGSPRINLRPGGPPIS